MNKTKIKELAQDLILQRVAVAYYAVEDEPLTPDEQEALIKEIRKQGNRVARLFNYDEQPFLG
jgi:hypothetical protein